MKLTKGIIAKARNFLGESIALKPKSLISQAHDLIETYYKGCNGADRVWFDVNLMHSGNVEVLGFIDGGPLVGKKTCATIEEINQFVEKIALEFN